MIPCAYLEHGTILRVVPYFIPCQGDDKNESTTRNSDAETKTYQYESSDSTSSASDSSLMIHQQSYIRPEYGESSAESAARHEEIDTRVRKRTAKRKRNRRNKRQQNVQELALEDINPHGLYANPIKPVAPVVHPVKTNMHSTVRVAHVHRLERTRRRKEKLIKEK